MILTAVTPTTTWYLVLAAGLFAIGMVGVLVRRNPLIMFMCIELMLNAVNLNLVAFWRYRTPTVQAIQPLDGSVMPFLGAVDGQVFAIFVIALAAAEAAVGLAMIIAIFRARRVVELEALDSLRG